MFVPWWPSRASDVAEKFLDVCLHAARMIEQTLGCIEHLVRGCVSRVGVTVQVDDIGGHRARTVGGRLRAGKYSGGLRGLLADSGRYLGGEHVEIFNSVDDSADG